METKQNAGLLGICVFLIVCLSVVFLPTSLQGSEKRHEVPSEITLPESKTDISRVIDAYERLMDNYMRLMESNLTGIRSDVREVTQKLDSIDHKISELSSQLERVQKKLGIEPPQRTIDKPLNTEIPLRPEKQNSEKLQ
jgi:peptidoglycan hydrolase CwlO-like protein